MGTQPPLPKKVAELPPQFSAHVCCGQTAGWIQIAFGMEVGLGRSHIVLDGDPAPLPKKGAELPQFSAHFYCGETAGCIKMPLGMEEGLSPGDFVLDGDSAPLSPKRGRSSLPNFRPYLLWPNSWMDQDGTWHGGGTWTPQLCRTISSQLRHVWIMGKKLVQQQYLLHISS